jgi:hypothetical protein
MASLKQLRQANDGGGEPPKPLPARPIGDKDWQMTDAPDSPLGQG